MKLNIKIDTNVSEPEALIVTPKVNEEVSKIVDFIEKLHGMTTVISGTKEPDGILYFMRSMRFTH